MNTHKSTWLLAGRYVFALMVSAFSLSSLATSSHASHMKDIDCSEVPVKITHSAFPMDGFKCQVAAGKQDYTFKEHKIFQNNQKGNFLNIRHYRAMGRTYMKAMTDERVADHLKAIDSWVRDNSYNWTGFATLAGGRYVLFLGKKGSNPVWTCFGHHSVARAKGSGYKFRRSVIYCETGVEHLSEDAVGAFLDTVEFVAR